MTLLQDKYRTIVTEIEDCISNQNCLEYNVSEDERLDSKQMADLLDFCRTEMYMGRIDGFDVKFSFASHVSSTRMWMILK